MEILGGIVSDIVENITTAGEKNTLLSDSCDKGTEESENTTGDKYTMTIDDTANSTGLVLVKQQHDCGTSISDTLVEEDIYFKIHTNLDTLTTKTKHVNKSLKRKGILVHQKKHLKQRLDTLPTVTLSCAAEIK